MMTNSRRDYIRECVEGKGAEHNNNRAIVKYGVGTHQTHLAYLIPGTIAHVTHRTDPPHSPRAPPYLAHRAAKV